MREDLPILQYSQLIVYIATSCTIAYDKSKRIRRKAAIEYFEQLAQHLPLSVFVFVGTFVEELLSPIPSFLVLIPAGATARVQQLTWLDITVLAAVCGAGRVLGGSILYWLATKLEYLLLGDRKLLGMTHQDIVALSRRMGSRDKAWHTWLLLCVLHALPVFPGTLLSAGAGFIKIRYVIFATATFVGSIVNAFIYLGLGYTGMQTAEYISKVGWLVDAVAALLLAAVAVWLIMRWRRKRTSKAKKPTGS